MIPITETAEGLLKVDIKVYILKEETEPNDKHNILNVDASKRLLSAALFTRYVDTR
jgi:hypothetical protein